MKHLVFALALTTVLACAPARAENDYGGNIIGYMYQVAVARNRDTGWRINGDCYSACTMRLGAPKTCVTRDARLGFHAPTIDNVFAPQYVPVLLMHYPPRMRMWAENTGALTSRHMTFISGAMALQLGARECSP